MKNINIIKQLTRLFLLLGISTIGCKKFVQIGPPTTQLAATSVFSTSAAATSAQMAIYIKMFNNNESYNMAQAGGLLSDELTSYSQTTTQMQYYTNNISAMSGLGPWNNAYNYIYQANAIIEGLQNNAAISPAIANQLTGESKFLRAFWHFYLTNLYGDVPLVLTTDYRLNGSIARSSQAAVYQQIIADLQSAQSMLNTNYVDVTDTVTTTERVRPNKAAAEALLARVYLYTTKYSLAEQQATLVINNPAYSLCPNLSGTTNSVFLKNSSEAIWQIQTPIPSNSYNTGDGFGFYLPSAPATGSTNSATISPQLQSSFESGDQRLVQWVGVYNATPTLKYYFPYKYHSYNIAATSLLATTEYTMILRLAEQYLIRAEARAQQGNMTGAAADLNIIRARAGLTASTVLTSTSTLTQAMTAILHERQLELFTEWGHRWLDLNRTGATASVMGSPGNVFNAKGGVGTWNATQQLFPISQSERNNDANLTQNPGY